MSLFPKKVEYPFKSIPMNQNVDRPSTQPAFKPIWVFVHTISCCTDHVSLWLRVC